MLIYWTMLRMQEPQAARPQTCYGLESISPDSRHPAITVISHRHDGCRSQGAWRSRPSLGHLMCPCL
jgi:hypothetical protein